MKSLPIKIILFLTCFDRSHGLKPYSKREQSVWRLECELGVIADSDCPVDGGWSPWGPWSPCQGTCDDVGHRRKQRLCNNPPPSQDGLPCIGFAEYIDACHLSNCSVDDFQKLVEGDAVRTLAFRQLEAVPALMEQCLQIECPYEGIETSLAADNTWQINAESIWNAIQCVKHNLGCPVSGEWGSWGAWSVCGARCGRGLRWRLRRCDNPPPSDAHLVCSGTPLQTQDCEGDQCAYDQIDDLSKDGGHWGEWGPWSSCSEKCGPGVRHRKRTCNDAHIENSFAIWGTYCRGQHDQVEVCNNRECVLDGGWSGWSAWGPCSQTCGPGRRSRSRSCTRPIPAGTKPSSCVGPRTEVSSCQLSPCDVYSHTVAVLTGESHIKYHFDKKRSTLFHFFVRFMPLSPHGTLVRRGSIHNPQIRLSLQKWHLCLDASGSSHSCDLPRICTTDIIEPATWHSALITVTSEAAILRLDDSQTAIRSTFPCDPELPNEAVNIVAGERLHGEIQELILNFMPLKIMINREQRTTTHDFSPTYVSNIAYEKANIEEAFLKLNNDQYLRLPCFDSAEAWKLSLTLKSNQASGTIFYLHDDLNHSWLYLVLQNLRLKLKLAVAEVHAESSSSSDYPIDQWLEIQLSKKKGTNTIEAALNSAEHLHVIYGEDTSRKRRKSSNTSDKHLSNVGRLLDHVNGDSNSIYGICNDEFFVGGIPQDLSRKRSEDLTPFNGVIASLSIDDNLQDLHACNIERYKDDKLQVSSRTASISGSYHETAWGNSNRLNLTCLHARSLKVSHSAHWLFLDTAVTSVVKDKKVRSIDDGKVLRLVASADNDLRGFYTCRSHSNRRTRNVVTYGVLGQIQYELSGPDTTTIIAVFTTLSLVLGTLLWLIIEGVHDLRNGFGFFRDAHLSPEEEAECVCKFIDNNESYIGVDAAKVAKARARRKAQQLASKSNFAAQEPQGLMQEENITVDNCDETTSASEPEVLPALPEVKSAETILTHNVFRSEPCYISSPRHGSDISERSKVTSSSVHTSPRFLCSQLLTAKRRNSSKPSCILKRGQRRGALGLTRKARSKLLTIKSSSFVNISPAQKILQKFQQLKSDDTLE